MSLPNNNKIGERIRSIRENLNMSREKFSEMIDVSDVFLGQVERGERSLSIKSLFRVVSFTGVSSDYILFGNLDSSKHDRIFRILDNSSDEAVEYFYNLIISSSTLLKNYNNNYNNKQ